MYVSFACLAGTIITDLPKNHNVHNIIHNIKCGFEILNKIAQILNKKKWAKTEENVNNITKIMKNFKINQ